MCGDVGVTPFEWFIGKAEAREDAEERLREAQWYLDYLPPVPPEIVFESLVRAVRAYMKSKEEE